MRIPIPTTSQVRNAYATAPMATDPRPVAAEEFDAWLEDHDQKVRTEYEKRRAPGPIKIQNIDSQPANVWLIAEKRKWQYEALGAVAVDLIKNLEAIEKLDLERQPGEAMGLRSAIEVVLGKGQRIKNGEEE